MAMILACAAVLQYASAGRPKIDRASRAIYEAVMETTASGVRTPDLGGSASMSGFTAEVISRVQTKLEVWASLGSAV
jgi:isocitrate/isopropylmalate dehydrogenase